jgi:GH35 family endo-1,4-beta-xylanase
MSGADMGLIPSRDEKAKYTANVSGRLVANRSSLELVPKRPRLLRECYADKLAVGLFLAQYFDGLPKMGLMRFRVLDRQALPADAVDRAYFTGLDEIPWRSRTQWTDEGLSIRRAESDSGNFHIPWIVPGHGELCLQTGCLIERDEPYSLAVELARGTVNRIRNQLATWQASGITVGDKMPLLTRALDRLSKAATLQNLRADQAEEFAQQAILHAQELINQICRAYAENAIALRRKQFAKSAPVLGVNLGNVAFGEPVGRLIVNTFNTAVVPFCWGEIERTEGKPDWTLSDKQMEWSRANALQVVSGPLLSFDRLGLPPWLFLYEGDGDALFLYVAAHLKSVISRYRGRVGMWQAAARLNINDTLELGEEHRLRLAAFSIETIRALDANAPISISIDQPWAEFMRGQDCDFSPLHFADALVRADIGLDYLTLEINLGYASEATHLRDSLDFIRQIDRWSSLGLPLFITLTIPSSADPDLQARAKLQPLRASGGESLSQRHARYIEQLTPLLLAKPAVQGIVWNQLLDSAPHEFPHSGLFDAANQPKPIASSLKEVRQKVLV